MRDSLNSQETDVENSRKFAAHVADQFPEDFAGSKMAGYMRGAELEASWYGLARYWRKSVE